MRRRRPGYEASIPLQSTVAPFNTLHEPFSISHRNSSAQCVEWTTALAVTNGGAKQEAAGARQRDGVHGVGRSSSARLAPRHGAPPRETAGGGAGGAGAGRSRERAERGGG
ncbi:unnamed protein product [Prorocentrum cordatum]|uniref:Uncharacterized protein n=1 Tax=Prorocentrum cordatum TaxID=2364126 RepID=A0ABN9TJE3_9DINO|nr:unnamed protein product [Polarella glacialis]